MWLMACGSFVMIWASIHIERSYGHLGMDEALSAIPTRQPLVVAQFLIALLVTISHLLKSRSNECERG